MPEQSSFAFEENTITTFFKTPLMQTHQVAYTIAEFDSPLEDSSAEPFMQFFTRPSLLKEIQFAATHSRKVMTAIQEYLQFNYTLEKMDQIYLPNMESSENFGLVNYKESHVLFNENMHTISRKLNIAKHICKFLRIFECF